MLATAPQSQSAAQQPTNDTTSNSAVLPQDERLSRNSADAITNVASSLPPSYPYSTGGMATALPMKSDPVMLPPLSTVTRGRGLRGDFHNVQQPNSTASWSAISPIALPPSSKIESPSAMDLDTGTNSVNSNASPDRYDRYGDGRAPSVNLDDPDVRLAAEALGDLRAGKLALNLRNACLSAHICSQISSHRPQVALLPSQSALQQRSCILAERNRHNRSLSSLFLQHLIPS
jgi:hypothetical protein